MTIAYVLINSELGKGSFVEKKLKEINDVKEVYAVYGVYDYLAKIESRTMSELKEIISTRIRQIDHIRATITLITID